MPSRTSNTVKAQKETIDTTADIAKEHHDLFNLVALVRVIHREKQKRKRKKRRRHWEMPALV